MQHALNTSKTTHGYTPFYLNTGRECILPCIAELTKGDALLTIEDYQFEQLRNLQEGIRAARQALRNWRLRKNPRTSGHIQISITISWTLRKK